MTDSARASQSRMILLGLAGLCVALNVGVGAVAFLVKLPIYLDAIGTIVIAMLAGRLGFKGFLLAAGVGAASFLLTGLTLNPAVIWFIPTQVAIAAYAFYVARPLLGPRVSTGSVSGGTWVMAVVLGLGLGVVAGAVSAPIIAWVFGGITGAGASVITAILLKSGENLYNSVLASGLASEPLDKTLQILVALFLVMATPRRVRSALLG